MVTSKEQKFEKNSSILFSRQQQKMSTYIKRVQYNFTQNYIHDFDELIIRKIITI